MERKAGTVFRALLQELARTEPCPFFNAKGVIQSSVGMIFRLRSQQSLTTAEEVAAAECDQVELLFTQRADYEHDRNACTPWPPRQRRLPRGTV
jgi:hypothetical protein